MIEEGTKIRVRVKLFAIYQETLGTPELELEFEPETTVGRVLEVLIDRQPKLAQWQDVTRFGVNLQFVDRHTILKHGDEVVLIPPVSGG